MAATSREDILRSLRDAEFEAEDLPSLEGTWTQYEDRVEQFSRALESVGGRAVIVRDLQELNRELDQIPAFQESRKVCSLVAGIPKANVELSGVEDPHQLEDVDFFVAPGEFAVAENAAVWVTARQSTHRVLYFLSQHLALVVPAARMVDHMHQAYQRLDFSDPSFGLFISGPSKTADIEQSLVIGAHGARSLTVFVMADH